MSCDPKLVSGRPDLIEVWFLGERRNINRAWYNAVTDLANSNARSPRLNLEAHQHALVDKEILP